MVALLRRPLWLAAAVALPLALSACDSPEEKVAVDVADGRESLAAGDVDRASVHFRNALRIEPKNAAALLGIGRVHEQREDLRRAYVAYREAAAADPTLIEAHAAYGVLALTGNRLEDVEEAAGAIREVDPDHPDGLALAAALALRDGRLDAAEELAHAAVASAPGHVNATAARAGVANARGDAAAAVDIIDGRFDAHGVSVPLALLKVQLLAEAGDGAGVVAGLEQAIDATPEDVGLRIALAEFHASRGATDRAETVLREAIGAVTAPDAAMAALVRLVHVNRGLDAAIAELDRLQARPDATGAHDLAFLAADLLSAGGRPADAAARLQAVVDATEPDSATALDARSGLATLARERGDTARARTVVEEVLEADPRHRGANFLKATLDLEAGDVAAATAAARTSLADDPGWVPGLRLLARAHLAQGERDLAVETLNRVLRLAPDDVGSASQLAQLLADRGDHDEALEVWDHVIARSEAPSAALARTAAIAIRQQNWNRASRDIDRLLTSPDGAMQGTLLAGSMRVARGDTAGGREWFTRARRMDPDDSQALLGLVRTHLAEDDVAGALAVVGEELERRPDNALAHVLAAQLERRRGAAAAAVAAYRRAIDVEPGWDVPYRELAALHEATGDVDAAVDVLAAGADAGAAPGELRLRRAFTLQRAGAMPEAIAAYERMLDDGIEMDVVVNNFGALVADHARDDTARLERALALAERFATSDEPYFIDTLGWLHHRVGAPTQAVPLLRRATAMKPDDPQLRYHLGAALHAADEPERALAELERAVVEGADYPGLDEARALLETLEAEARAEMTTE